MYNEFKIAEGQNHKKRDCDIHYSRCPNECKFGIGFLMFKKTNHLFIDLNVANY